MHRISDEIVRLAWTQTWQLAVLVAAMWIVVRLTCRRRPHLAYFLWMLVVVKAVTPPVWSSPTSAFSWATAEVTHVAPAAGPEPPAAEPTVSLTLLGTATGPDGKIEPFPEAKPVVVAPPPMEPAWTLPEVAMVVWGGGAVLLLVVVVIRWIRLLRTLRAAAEPANAELVALFEIARKAIVPRRSVRLMCTSAEMGPAAIGWWGGTVILPASLVREKTAAQLSQIIAHELVHLRRGDTVAGHLQLAAQIIWWFHPAVWWANRQARIERERACDEEVVAELGCRPADYARLLVDVLEWKQRTPALLLPGMRARDVTEGRLRHLLQHAQPFRRRAPWGAWLVAIAALVVVVPGGALRYTIAEEQPAARVAAGRTDKADEKRQAEAELDTVANQPAREGDRESGRSIAGTGVNSNAGLVGTIVAEIPPGAPGKVGQGGWVFEVDPKQQPAQRDKQAVIDELKKLGLQVDFPQSTNPNVTIRFDYFSVSVPESFRPTEKPLPLGELKGWNNLQIGGRWNDGKQFKLTADQLREQLRAVRELPSSASLWIAIDAENAAGLDALAEFPHLESLMLWGHISERALGPLKHMKRLKQLSLNPLNGDSGTLDLAFVEGTPQLEHFSGWSLSEVALGRLARLPELRYLVVSTRSGEGLRQLATSKSLEELYLSLSATGGELVAADLASLSGLANLRRLRISAQAFPGIEPLVATDASFAGWRNLTRLETLAYEPCQISGAAIEELGHLTELRQLQLVGRLAVDDQGFLPLARLPKLTTLVLRSTQMTGATLAPLASAKTLNLLSLADSPVDDAGLGKIAELSALKQLDLSGTAITDQGLAQLKGKLPQLERLNLARTKLTDRGFEALLGRPRLYNLNACDTDLTAKLMGRMMAETTVGMWPRKIWATDLGDPFWPIQLP